ncbi:MAG: urease accessory UreF family protein [Candidatus Acidiferrales bacterium]
MADSTFPIGALAHSFGIETLVSAGLLAPGDLENFLLGYLEEAGVVEAVFCRQAARLATASGFPAARWRELNDTLAALRPGREARAGSVVLGRNFLRAVLALGESRILREALEAADEFHAGDSSDGHSRVIEHSPAFGLVGGTLRFDEETVVLAYLHQWVASFVSGFQRLLPLGQTHASRILWNLKPATLEAATRSAAMSLDDVSCFTPLPDWGAMEHPALSTRLFIS